LKVPSLYFGSKSPFAHNTFLRKRLQKSRYCKCKICSLLFIAKLQLSKKSSRPPIWLRFLQYVYTLLMYTSIHLSEVDKRLCS